jgi:hypothetical protein
MFTACFDASGHPRDPATPFLIVAGFISTAEQWINFDAQWRQRLDRDGISCFHATQFHGGYGEFSSWRSDEKRRRTFQEDLLEIIRANTFRWVGHIFVNKDVSALTMEQRKKWHVNAYSFASACCIVTTSQWLHREKITSPMTYVFEDGDFGRGELIAYTSERLQFKPIFAPKKDTKNKIGNLFPGFTPLQAADFLAHTIFRACGRGSYPVRKMDWLMSEFYRMPCDSPVIFDVPALTNYAEQMKIWEEQWEKALATTL